ncbi:hypothetical protein PAPYR_10216 [Paratrimastix pyriformis]|uniref:PB1 domain-containing protein n=1 Tax=Paratrimastix pyriformis TaxID=342808 RepID=A0ABQ8U968_9EUKA|nr:hypothetical protein PAPYR_10216 [Paratrimastix pyriformis]
MQRPTQRAVLTLAAEGHTKKKILVSREPPFIFDAFLKAISEEFPGESIAEIRYSSEGENFAIDSDSSFEAFMFENITPFLVTILFKPPPPPPLPPVPSPPIPSPGPGFLPFGSNLLATLPPFFSSNVSLAQLLLSTTPPPPASPTSGLVSPPPPQPPPLTLVLEADGHDPKFRLIEASRTAEVGLAQVIEMAGELFTGGRATSVSSSPGDPPLTDAAVRALLTAPRSQQPIHLHVSLSPGRDPHRQGPLSPPQGHAARTPPAPALASPPHQPAPPSSARSPPRPSSSPPAPANPVSPRDKTTPAHQRHATAHPGPPGPAPTPARPIPPTSAWSRPGPWRPAAAQQVAAIPPTGQPVSAGPQTAPAAPVASNIAAVPPAAGTPREKVGATINTTPVGASSVANANSATATAATPIGGTAPRTAEPDSGSGTQDVVPSAGGAGSPQGGCSARPPATPVTADTATATTAARRLAALQALVRVPSALSASQLLRWCQEVRPVRGCDAEAHAALLPLLAGLMEHPAVTASPPTAESLFWVIRNLTANHEENKTAFGRAGGAGLGWHMVSVEAVCFLVSQVSNRRTWLPPGPTP